MLKWQSMFSCIKSNLLHKHLCPTMMCLKSSCYTVQHTSSVQAQNNNKPATGRQ
jgi:hypothetical protein